MTEDTRKDDEERSAADAGGDTGDSATEAPHDDAAPAAGNDGDTEEKTAARPSRVPLLLALVAALVSLLALAGVATLWLADRGPDELALDNQSALERLRGDLAANARDIDATRDALDELRSANAATGDAVDALQRTLNERLRPLEAVPGRLSSIESSLSALQGISSGLRDTWLLSEAEYYLQIANAQLQLARNPALARIALELADERLVSLGNPALTDVRRAIADERRELQAIETTDVEGAALTLASIADAIGTLPLEANVVQPDLDDDGVADNLSGTDRALATVKNALSSAISVRRTDEPAKTLLPPDAAWFLQNNLMLQLQTARLALLRGERTIFEQSLDDAAEWINEYYDTDSRTVRSTLSNIASLRDTRFSASLPDISRSLALLRQYMSLSASERNVPGSGAAPQ